MSSAPIKFYFDLLSQPSRALYIFLKQAKIPTDDHPIALRKGKDIRPSNKMDQRENHSFLLLFVFF